MENGQFRINSMTLKFKIISAGDETAKSGKKGDEPKRPFGS